MEYYGLVCFMDTWIFSFSLGVIEESQEKSVLISKLKTSVIASTVKNSHSVYEKS